MVKRFLTLILMLQSLLAVSQNFVPNGSFESYAQCPTARNDGRRCFSWNAPTLGTSDYFNTCALPSSNVDVPTNFAGTQSPRTGNAYSGLYASQNFTAPFLEYREYMQVTLDSLLIAGGVYTFEMYVSLADYSNFASNKMAAYISATRPTSNTDTYLNVKPQIVSPTYITDKTGWTRITGTYVATGGERYITIGVFEPAATNTKIAVSGGSNDPNYDGVSYYYIDDVSLTRACDLPDTLLGPDIKQCVVSYPSTVLSAAGPGSRAYLWNTGATTSTITITQPGTYSVKVNTPFCTRYDTIVVNYPLIPVVDLGNDTSICGTINMELDAQHTGATFIWSTGSANQKIRVTEPGEYKVAIAQNGCFFRDSITINQDTMPLLELGPADTLCDGLLKLLDATSPRASYLWQDGSTNPTYLVRTSGNYRVIVTRGVCVTRDSVYIVFDPKPILNLGKDTSYCFQQPIPLVSPVSADRYRWQDESTAANLTALKAGIYWLEITKGKCIVRDTLTLQQKKIPLLDLGPDRKICSALSIDVNLQPIAQNALWNDSSTDLVRQLKAPGFFSVAVINEDGCTASDTVVLDTFPTPLASLGPDSFVCEGSSYRLTPGTFSSYTWQDNSQSNVFNATAAGKYYVSVKDQNNCEASDTVVLTTKSKPAISMVKLLRMCNPDTLITPKGIFKTYLWQDGSTDTSYRVRDYGIFTFTATDSNNCSNVALLEVKNDCPPVIFVPNAFTPNDGDGLNDFFFPVIRNVKEIEFKVYNRWGELLFETTKLNDAWDGTFRNKPATADVYVYTIKFVATNGDNGIRNGNVTLLR